MTSRFREGNEVKTATHGADDPVAVDAVAEGAADDPRLAACLDHVASGLRRLPPAVRADIRRELRSHLLATRDALIELGEPPEVALAAALERFGDPVTVARRYCRAWTSAEGREVGAVTAEAARGLAGFVAVSGVLLAAQGALIMRAAAALQDAPAGNWSVAMSGPQEVLSGALGLATFAGWLLLPLVIGARAGWRFPRRAALAGVLRAAALIGLCTAPFLWLAVVGGMCLAAGEFPTADAFSSVRVTYRVPLTVILFCGWLPCATVGVLGGRSLRSRFGRDRRVGAA